MQKKERLYIKRFEDDEVDPRSSDYYYNDWELSQDIRDAIEENGSVSFDSKEDIQIMVEKGFVILRGTVFSHQDKVIMGHIASVLAGSDHCLNQLVVVEDLD